MTLRLILSDIDGCISPEESRAWDAEPFARFMALSHAASAGTIPLPPLTLCTGRPQPYVEALMKILDIRFPAICEAGAVLYSLQDNRARLAPEITAERLRGLHALRRHVLDVIVPSVPGLVYQFGKEAQLSLYSESPECFDEIAEKLHAFASETPGLEIVVTPSHYYLNIDLAGVSKGRAITGLLHSLELTRDEAAGIGDTLGDLSIRDAVAFFACPANAVPEIQAAADYVSPWPDIHGVLDILERIQAHGEREDA